MFRQDEQVGGKGTCLRGRLASHQRMTGSLVGGVIVHKEMDVQVIGNAAAFANGFQFGNGPTNEPAYAGERCAPGAAGLTVCAW